MAFCAPDYAEAALNLAQLIFFEFTVERSSSDPQNLRSLFAIPPGKGQSLSDELLLGLGNAHAHLKVMGGVKSTQENLHGAIEGEGHEFKNMYPGFVAEAEKEANKPALFSFKNALAVEEIHHGLYTEALNAVKSGSDLPQTSIYLCPVCGNPVKSEVPEKCPICNTSKDKFFEVK